MRFARALGARISVSCLCCALLAPFLAKRAVSQESPIAVRGELQQELSLTLADLEALPRAHLPAAVLIGDCEGFHGIHDLDGVPLSALVKKYTAVPDPAPYDRYVLIASGDGYCATYSFGELFNSRMGDQIVVATVKDGKPLSPADGFAMSVTGEDSTGGRSVRRIKQIEIR